MMEAGESLSLEEDVKVEAIPTEANEETTKQSEADLEEEPSEIRKNSLSEEDKEEVEEKPQLTIVDANEEKQLKDDPITQETQSEVIKEETQPLPDEDTEDNTIADESTNHDETAAEVAVEEDEAHRKSKAEDTIIPKLNGNHSLSIHDEESCSSSSSSASSHNLVIDHPLAEKSPQHALAEVEDNGPLDGKSLKRKLSACENGSPQYKQIHLDNEREDTQPRTDTPSVEADVVPEEPVASESSRQEEEPAKGSPRETSTAIAVPAIEAKKPSSPNPFEQYAVALANSGLPPPKLTFECFRCKKCDFETFKELREHHKICWFVDGKVPVEKSEPTPPPLPLQPSQPTQPLPLVEPSEPPPPSAAPTPKKRFYLCSSCGTYHENWNLFLHIREIHNRHVCLYCIRLFPTAEKLSLHLEIKHDLEQNHFNSEEKLRSVGDGNSRFLMCCTCQHVFSEHERFSDHVCTEYMQPCTLCNQKGRHLSSCKANPEKRPKVKKKAKPATITTKSALQPTRKSSGTPVPPAGPPAPCENKSSSAQATMSTLPVLLQPAPSPGLSHPPQQEFAKQNGFTTTHQTESQAQTRTDEFNYHSDDSTNMVIDETCSNNTYVNEMAIVNPFKALDERERLQGEILKTDEPRLTLPPDRVPESIPEPRPLIVPKIKLRVPKEFQKAVESEISSTDSDDDEDEEVDEEAEAEEEAKEPNATAPHHNNISMFNAREDESDNDGCSADDKENTQEWDEPNSNLDRILKEIEKTKLDIQRTKEMLEPSSNVRRPVSQAEVVHVLQESHSPEREQYLGDSMSPAVKQEPEPEPGHQHAPQPQQELDPEPEPVPQPEHVPIHTAVHESEAEFSWLTPERDMCSPTPPPTPNSVWQSPLYMSEVSPAVLQAVSERENIENMEKESEQAKEQTSESDKMDTSGELDVETVPNSQEDSAMDADEKNSTTESQQNPSTPQQMDFTPIVSNEPKNIEKTPTEALHPVDDKINNEKLPPADGIEVATEDTPVVDLLLDRPLEKFETIEFVRLCITAVYTLCLYCNHARRIAVNGHSLVLHLLAQHRFSATVDSITAEELLPSTIVSKLKSFLPILEEHYLNLKTYCSLPPKETNVIPCDEREFECFQCRFSTKMHKDLYLHNRKMHLKTAILCFMCRANFFSFSEILCHICPGVPNKVTVFDIKFRCCLCEVDGIPSPFRLMVHLRKKHFACDICLEDCREQGRLSSHVWKHKLHHLCYRCGIAYRNKMDITKHLFWKHGTESIICKRCLQKRWRHVYHFCVPPPTFVCEVCSLCFSKATYLKVHKRVHSGDFRYPCTEDNCEEKFISRKLLLKHSATHAPPEVKIEEKAESVVDLSSPQEEGVKTEEPPKEEKPSTDSSDDKGDPVKEENNTKVEKETEQTSRRKKKKNRNKESLEDLNLIAPNLSESDSSDESDIEKPKTDKDALVPNVMLSPPSEDDKDEEKEEKQIDKDTGKIMDIWENFKTFQASQQPKQDEEDNETYSESNYPTPILHVAVSDHDYCAMYKVRPRAPPVEERKPEVRLETETVYNTSDNEGDRHNSNLREKSISPSKKKRKSTGSGSSSSDSSSGSDSSCSCGSNCSCSSSGSSSNSSSSSGEDSDSSTSEGRRRIAEKKQERADRNRWKSEGSPKASVSENADIVVEDKEPIVVAAVKESPEPVLIETDLETAESETDEEFYDEHPQKLASEMLAQKRLQLRAQMRLSPSHNYDIMENSRPSTPSLPEEVVKEKKVKLKKKKRDRKSTSKSQAVPPIKLNLSVNKVEHTSQETMVHQQSMQVPEVDLVPPYDLIASPGVAEPPVAQQPPPAPFLQNVIKPFLPSRMSEGSSCSDADNSLKRSKRARRPNKFYGYTSDDENTPGTPLMIGSRTFKPQPPPQLTWRKEDLPTPSKSILLNKQPRSPRTPKTPAGSSAQLKKRAHQKPNAKQKQQQQKLPPIPTLKIRPSKIGLPVGASVLPPPPPPSNHTYSSSRDDSDDTDSSDDDLELPASNTLIPAAVPLWNQNAATEKPQIAHPPAVAVEPPHPPPPQASMFNQKIPPALLPNPDFATIQYFKRNNIRYPIRPPAGARQPRDGESVYCYCRCPYDEVSEMIACDGENCLIEWFHFECVGIMVAPQGKWFCAECRPKYSNELYPNM